MRRRDWGEGGGIVPQSLPPRLRREARTREEDGMDLLRVETFQAPAANGLPSEAELTGKIEKMAADLSALRKAPVAEPHDGTAALICLAAAAFFAGNGGLPHGMQPATSGKAANQVASKSADNAF